MDELGAATQTEAVQRGEMTVLNGYIAALEHLSRTIVSYKNMADRHCKDILTVDRNMTNADENG